MGGYSMCCTNSHIVLFSDGRGFSSIFGVSTLYSCVPYFYLISLLIG